MTIPEYEPEALESIRVPCPQCLRQLLREQVSEPHACAAVSCISIDGGVLIMGPEQDCPCPCQAPAAESEALKAARAEARSHAPDSSRPPRTP